MNTEPFGGYRGPLVDSVTTEVAQPDTPPSPFYRLIEGDVGYPELRALADEILSSESGGELGGEAQLPRVISSEDDMTFEASLSEVELWMKLLDRGNPEDDPPPSAPDSALPWWLKDDEEGDDEQKPDQKAA